TWSRCWSHSCCRPRSCGSCAAARWAARTDGRSPADRAEGADGPGCRLRSALLEHMIEPFRHNSLATNRLLEFCRDRGPAPLEASAPGTYGPVKETLAHYLGWEEVLAGAVEGTAPQAQPVRFTSVDDLLERGRSLAERWERLLEPEPHPARLL